MNLLVYFISSSLCATLPTYERVRSLLGTCITGKVYDVFVRVYATSDVIKKMNKELESKTLEPSGPVNKMQMVLSPIQRIMAYVQRAAYTVNTILNPMGVNIRIDYSRIDLSSALSIHYSSACEHPSALLERAAAEISKLKYINEVNIGLNVFMHSCDVSGVGPKATAHLVSSDCGSVVAIGYEGIDKTSLLILTALLATVRAYDNNGNLSIDSIQRDKMCEHLSKCVTRAPTSFGQLVEEGEVQKSWKYSSDSPQAVVSEIVESNMNSIGLPGAFGDVGPYSTANLHTSIM